MAVINKRRIEACKGFMVQIYDVAYDPSNPVQGTISPQHLRNLKGQIKNYALYGSILNEHGMIVKRDKLWHIKYRKEDLHLFDSIIEKWIGQRDEKYELNRMIKQEQIMKIEQEEAERKAEEALKEAEARNIIQEIEQASFPNYGTLPPEAFKLDEELIESKAKTETLIEEAPKPIQRKKIEETAILGGLIYRHKVTTYYY